MLVLLGGICWPVGRVAIPSPFAAVPPMIHSAAQELAVTLLRNIYRAFDYQQASDVYEVLAQSVDGRLLPNSICKYPTACIYRSKAERWHASKRSPRGIPSW